MRESKHRRFLLLWCIVVSAVTAALLVHLSLRSQTIQLGYDIDRLRKEASRLVEQKRALSIERASLTQSERIKQTAENELGMQMPEASQFISLNNKRKRIRTSGRAR